MPVSLPPGAAPPRPALDIAPVSAVRSGPLDVSIVIPCLNEADTVADCVDDAWRGLGAGGLAGEVIVADNGSTDESVRLAAAADARVVPVATRGYGAALVAGIAAAQAPFVVLADADMSYDFSEIPRFVAALRGGADLVMGCRLPAGGGRILPGAMPVTHRWIGNPLFSALARAWFAVPVRDVYCGLRGLRVDLLPRLTCSATDMTFAVEMVVRATLVGATITELPITLHPDRRRRHRGHLRTVRDGLRTLARLRELRAATRGMDHRQVGV